MDFLVYKCNDKIFKNFIYSFIFWKTIIFASMSRRRSERQSVQNIIQQIEENETLYANADNIDVAFIPDPSLNDSEDDSGKKLKYSAVYYFAKYL